MSLRVQLFDNATIGKSSTTYTKNHRFIVGTIVILLSLIILITTENAHGEQEHSDNIELTARALYGMSNDVDVQDDIAYVCVGSSLFLFDISEKTNPQVISQLDSFPTTPRQVFIEDNYAIVNAGPFGIYIIDVSDKEKPVEISHYQSKSDMDFDVMHVQDNFVYVGRVKSERMPNDLLSIIDIQDKENPKEVGAFSTLLIEEIPYGIFTLGDYAYLACGWDGLLIFDISDKANPEIVSIWKSENFSYSVFVEGNFAYVAGDLLHIVDISNKRLPYEVGRSPQESSWQVHVVDDYAYVSDFYRGVFIHDVSDKENPYPVGYYDSTTNKIAFGACAPGIFALDDYVYIANGIHLGFHILDVTIKEAPIRVGLYEGSDSIGDIDYQNDYVYLIDGFYGLRIFDVTEKDHPTEVGRIRDRLFADVQVIDDYLFTISGMDGGLVIFNIVDKENPIEVGFSRDMQLPWGFHVVDDYAYIADNREGLLIYDVSIKEAPVRVGSIEIYHPRDVYVEGNHAFVGTSSEGLYIIDVANKQSPEEVAHYNESSRIFNLMVVDDIAYLVVDNGMKIVNVSEKTNPEDLASYPYQDSFNGKVFVSGSNAFFTNGSGYRIVDIGDKEHPDEVGYYNSGSRARGLFVHENYAFVGCSNDGFYLFEMTDILITLNDNDGSDEWYDEPIYIGGITTVIIVVVVVVALLFTRKRNAEYYEDWGDEESYEDSDEEW